MKEITDRREIKKEGDNKEDSKAEYDEDQIDNGTTTNNNPRFLVSFNWHCVWIEYSFTSG